MIICSTFNTSVGPMSLARTEHGICFLAFTDNQEKVEIDLQNAHGHRQIRFLEHDEKLDQYAQKIIDSLATGDRLPSLPLVIKGTDFQKQVWQALQNIPKGQPISYKDLAMAMGKPKGYRAVARACATNDIAYLIPCHRVVASDGKLQGFRWGLDVKKRLLDKEAVL